MEQNVAAAHISLDDADMKRLEEIIPLQTDTGARYSDAVMKHIDMK